MSSSDIEWAVAYASDMAVAAGTPEEAHAWAAAREVALIWRRWLTADDHDVPGGSSEGIERVEEETGPHLAASKAWPPARPQEPDRECIYVDLDVSEEATEEVAS